MKFCFFLFCNGLLLFHCFRKMAKSLVIIFLNQPSSIVFRNSFYERCLQILEETVEDFIFIIIQREKTYPTIKYILKVSNKDTRKRCEVRWKLITKTPERPQWRSGVVVKFEPISNLCLMLLLLAWPGKLSWVDRNVF